MKTIKTVTFIVSMAILASCNQSAKKAGEEKEHSHDHDHDAEMVHKGEFTACHHASKIYWKGSKPTGEHNGIIKLKEGGDFIVEDGKLTGGTFIIDMNSIANIDLENEEMNGKLVGHLKSPDFFSVDSFPEAKFVITQLTAIEEEGFNTLVNGDLTIKDVTHPIKFKADVKINEGNVTAKSEEIVLDRTKWGVNYQSKSVFKELKDKFIDDEFAIKIEAYSM